MPRPPPLQAEYRSAWPRFQWFCRTERCHQLVEVPFYLVGFALPPLLCVVVDVRLKVGNGCKADGAVHLNELHPAVEVKSERMTVHDVFLLRKERAHELATEGTGSSKVLGAELVLLLTRDFCVDVNCLCRERVVIVALMQLVRVVQVDFEDVMLFLIIPPIARSLVLECREGITAIVVAYPLVLVIRQRLRHCLAVKVVCVHVHYVGSGLGRIVWRAHQLVVCTGVSD